MRRLLTALPFALLPLLASTVDIAQAAPTEHGSLGTHEHGVARLNAALDGTTLELELQSPAMNLVGFEHPASTPSDQGKVAEVRNLLEQPLKLFQLDAAAGCQVATQSLESPLFGGSMAVDSDDVDDDDGDDHDHDHAPADGQAHPHAHSEIHALYQLTCSHPEALKQLSLAPLFKQFPTTRVVQVQLIAPSGQKGLDATAANNSLTF